MKIALKGGGTMSIDGYCTAPIDAIADLRGLSLIACTAAEHDAIAASDERWQTEMGNHRQWCIDGEHLEMAEHKKCGSSWTREARRGRP